MFKVGIIGGGRMGTAHAGNLKAMNDVEIAGVYDINPENAAAHSEKFGGKIFSSAEELVNSPDVDLIVITSPTYCHKEGILAAVKTGKPIFCEKPLCRTKEDMAELAPIITNYPNLFAIGFVRRYSAGSIMMKQMIEEGKIGKLLCGSICCTFGGFKREWGDWFADYDKSGGVMLDMLAHHCDLQNQMAGKPVSVYAKSFMLNKGEEKPFDYVSATATYENGYIGNLECSWLRGGPSDTYIIIYGDKGALKLSDREGLIYYETGKAGVNMELDEGIVGHLQEKITGGMYAMEMAVIIDCAKNHKKPYAGAEEALNAMKFCFGMMDSAETGKVINF